MMYPIKLAVIGAGHLGKIHAKLASGITDFEVVGIVDPIADSRNAVCDQFGVPGFDQVDAIIDQVDAAIIATPTSTHCEVAKTLLSRGKHVLVEKPITLNTADAQQLVDLAERKRCILQVGHVERFNPAFREAARRINKPRFIQGARTTGYTFRSVDVGVTLDLMIHDIDLVLSLVRSPVVKVQATGLTVFGPHEDIVEARLTFANGCVANLTASRASFEPTRRMDVLSDTGFLGIDFATRKLQTIVADGLVRTGASQVHDLTPEGKNYVRNNLFSAVLPLNDVELAASNAIEDELKEFADCIRRDLTPTVTGQAGMEALEVAERVVQAVQEHRWDSGKFTLVGPTMRPEPKRAISAWSEEAA